VQVVRLYLIGFERSGPARDSSAKAQVCWESSAKQNTVVSHRRNHEAMAAKSKEDDELGKDPRESYALEIGHA
jgi:hypothetical protein